MINKRTQKISMIAGVLIGATAISMEATTLADDKNDSAATPKQLYDVSVKKMDGEQLKLSKYEGDVLLIVNVAITLPVPQAAQAREQTNDQRTPLPLRHHLARRPANARRPIRNARKGTDRGNVGCAWRGLRRRWLARSQSHRQRVF